jgi:hypothetical protein
VVSVIVPETRWESIAAAVILFVAAWFGVPALVRFFSSFTGDEEVLANGASGIATITSLKPTGWHYNRYYPIVRFDLSVEAGGAAYPVEIKQTVNPELLTRLAPGMVVGVRIDRENHKNVVIDWREPIRAATGGAGAELAGNQTAQIPASSHQSTTRSLWPFLRWGFLIFGLIFFRLSCEESYYEKDGVRVQGVVIKKTYSPGTRSSGRSHRSSSKHYVSYRFTTKEGRTLEGRYDVLPGMWEKLKEGAPVVVEYLSDSPGTNRIPEQRASFGTWRIMALILLVASAVLFIIGRRQRLAQAPQ